LTREVAEGFVGAKRRALEQAIPMFAHLELTYSCNWRCGFCYNPRRFDRRRLRLAEWEAVLDGLRAMGTLTVTLTGGEPLTHPEFFEIAEAVRRRAFALRIFTNGSLVTDAVAARITALRPLAVELSLHGATPHVHDRTTGCAGSFEALSRGVRALKEAGVSLVLKTPLTTLNEAELDDMIALTERWGVPYRIDSTLTPKDDGDRSPLAYAASQEAIERLMVRMKALGQLPTVGERSEGGYNCGLGRLTLAVDPEGNVFPCLQWRHRALGNVRQAPVKELWGSSQARIEAAEASRAVNDRLVRLGGGVSRFPFCPALAFQHTGNPVELDVGFLTRAAIAERVRSATPVV
jgi:MoaA/NifB/PqqE/SkfB family radical SAM enzyme